MNELIDTNPDINVRDSEYKRLLGYPPNYELEGRAKELAGWARQWYMENGKPWVYAVKTDELDIQDSGLGALSSHQKSCAISLRKGEFTARLLLQ